MDLFITLSKLCYIVADLGKFKGIQLLLIIIFFLLLDHFRVVNRCLGREVWPGHSDPDPILTQLTDFPDHL